VLTQPINGGTLTLNSNGSITYAPRRGYIGPDSFTYKLLGGTWSRDSSVPLSEDSGIVKVKIMVNP